MHLVPTPAPACLVSRPKVRWHTVQEESFQQKAQGSGLSHLLLPHPLQDLRRCCASNSFGGSSQLSAGSAGCCADPSRCGPRPGTAVVSSWLQPSPVGSGAQRCAESVPSLWPAHTHRNQRRKIKSRMSFQHKVEQNLTICSSMQNEEVLIFQLVDLLQQRSSL